MTTSIVNTSLTVEVSSGGDVYSATILKGPPFGIILTLNDVEEIYITGEDLIMENVSILI